MTLPPVLNFNKWVEEHEHLLRPPVNNQQMYSPDGDFIIQVVGGPNQRADYHVDPYEEWFYQIRGNMHVDVMDEGEPKTIHIKEGDTWLMPAYLPHSPQRPEEGSIGIVVERIREEGTLEKFQWYCFDCHHLVHEVELQVRDLVKDMPPVFEAFYADEESRLCSNCGALHPGKG